MCSDRPSACSGDRECAQIDRFPRVSREKRSVHTHRPTPGQTVDLRTLTTSAATAAGQLPDTTRPRPDRPHLPTHRHRPFDKLTALRQAHGPSTSSGARIETVQTGQAWQAQRLSASTDIGGSVDATLRVEREQVVRHRLAVNNLTARLPSGSTVEAAEFGLQDSAPRDGLLGLHARIEGCRPGDWQHPGLIQTYSPRAAVYLLPQHDLGLFTLGRVRSRGGSCVDVICTASARPPLAASAGGAGWTGRMPPRSGSNSPTT